MSTTAISNTVATAIKLASARKIDHATAARLILDAMEAPAPPEGGMSDAEFNTALDEARNGIPAEQLGRRGFIAPARHNATNRAAALAALRRHEEESAAMSRRKAIAHIRACPTRRGKRGCAHLPIDAEGFITFPKDEHGYIHVPTAREEDAR